ncbi:MAG: SRPBCC family protein [Actinomycetota bacterium]|nr:SRPBCC family protein [Actinomycetota bacterium]
MGPYVVGVERVVPANPQAVFDVLADPARHPALDGSGSVRSGRGELPARLYAGARFSMNMRMVLPYRVTNVVVEFDEPRLIAWRHFAGHRWRYRLTAVSEGTLVREEWDSSGVAHLWPGLRLLGFPERNRRGMAASLERLAEIVG